jgi:FkbM family methyltransferase
MIRAALASIPSRRELLRHAVASLLPQVGRLGVYLNGYTVVPDFLEHDRIDVVHSQDNGDLGDAGKMFWTDAGDFGHYRACDDDLVYPPDYAQRMVAAVEHYRRRALVSCHGVMMREKPSDYYRSRARVYRATGSVAAACSVHIIGTGAACWHRSLGVGPQVFEHPNMADMWLSAWANERRIPRIVIPHGQDWLRLAGKPSGTIWRASRRRAGGAMDTSEIQGRIARETAWRASRLPTAAPLEAPPVEPRPACVVSIITYAREDCLRHLLDEVERERERFGADVKVRVYDDASPGYEDVRALCAERGYTFVSMPEHYDKARHWQLVSRELGDLRAVPADWYVFLPDDARLCDHFFARAIAAWETLDRPAAMNLAHHSSRPGSCWTHVEPREIGDGVENGWIDGLYMCRRPMLETLDYRVPVPSQQYVDEWVSRTGSTGVGAVMSRALVEDGARLYRVKRSLTQHQDVPSIMHTERRKAEPNTHLYPLEPFATYPVGAARIAADPADHVGKVITGGAWYEADVLAAAKATGASGLYLDVGAHVGNHTAYFATECGASVLAVEPNTETYARLVATVEASGISERVRTLRAAVHPEWKTGRVIPAPAGNSGMVRVADGGDVGTVPVVRLDDLVGNERVGLLKIDVEGNVLGVLDSAVQVLKRDRPVIVAEAGKQKDEVTKLLAGLGYGEPIGHYGWTPVWLWLCEEAGHKRPPAPQPAPVKAAPRRRGPRVSLAMMAHPKRRKSAERVLTRLDRGCTVVWDEKDDRWDTGRRAWLTFDQEATHHAVIQDDVLVCRDLVASLERALAYVPPGAALSGYVGRVRPQTEEVLRAVACARDLSASFITMRCLNWGPLVIVPTELIPEMIRHCDTLRNVPNYDRRLSRFLELKRGRRVWYTWPNLVDHADGPSMVKGRAATDRRRTPLARVAHEFIGEDASALEVDWSRRVVDVDHLPARVTRNQVKRRSALHIDRTPAKSITFTPVVYRNRGTGERLLLKPWSPRVRRLRGLPSWELVTEGAQA